MFLQHGMRHLSRRGQSLISAAVRNDRRYVHDGRNRLSNIWTPTQRLKKKNASEGEDGHDLLLRAGFLRQAQSGIFHLLPFGLRVLNKIEALLDKHMSSLGASKVSLSSLSSQDLWEKSGRLDGRNDEFLKLQDRKGAKFLLSPTHEEEITAIVANAVHSYKDLPLRLYQVTRKYRDEARPRQGLLRGREFVMKDLYTFDSTEEQAMQTYDEVRNAYCAFLDELGLPYLVANADSGNMGGSHSHEYHFVSSKGEDTIISCTHCDLTSNEELFRDSHSARATNSSDYQILYGRLRPFNVKAEQGKAGDVEQADPTVIFVKVFVPAEPFALNVHALKDVVPDLDTRVPLDTEPPEGIESIPDELQLVVLDPRISFTTVLAQSANQGRTITNIQIAPSSLSRAQAGDLCPACKTGHLKLNPAVEIGHTFHLGTRYSRPLSAKVLDAENKEVEISMGCHGVGVSRLMGVVASLMADRKGLNWPDRIAPFQVVIVAAGDVSSEDITSIYDQLTANQNGDALDAIIDDRNRPLGWRLNDADLIGYPFIVVLGKSWAEKREVELQHRASGSKQHVDGQELASVIHRHRHHV